jgi:hypothetical protein
MRLIGALVHESRHVHTGREHGNHEHGVGVILGD